MDDLEQTGSIPVPLVDSYWVLEGKLLAGSAPCGSSKMEMVRNLARLLNAGITCFLDLREPGENCSYEDDLSSEAAHLGIEIIYHRRSISDGDIPNPTQMMAILNQVDDWLADDRLVYVHCQGGAGRTGTVVGCYLVRHGLESEEALAKLRELRLELPGGGGQSPETQGQIEMVQTWRQGG